MGSWRFLPLMLPPMYPMLTHSLSQMCTATALHVPRISVAHAHSVVITHPGHPTLMARTLVMGGR